MIDDRTIGKIQQSFAETRCVSETARILGVCRATVNKFIRLGANPRKEYSRRESPRAILIMRILKKLSRATCEKGGRTWPEFGSCEQMQRELASRHEIFLSVRQVHRYLQRLGLRSYVRPTCPTRREKDVDKRMKFARREIRKDWKRLVFSDESWLTCNEKTGKRQWADSRKKVLPREQRARWNVASVMVWAAFGYNYRSELVVFPAKREEDGIKKPFRLDAKRYVRRCLQPVVPALLSGNRTLLQDGARSHAAASTITYLRSKGVSFIADFPPYSPDFNMIEPLWKTFSEKVGEACPMSVEELASVAKKVWRELPQELLNAHASHFHNSLKKAIFR